MFLFLQLHDDKQSLILSSIHDLSTPLKEALTQGFQLLTSPCPLISEPQLSTWYLLQLSASEQLYNGRSSCERVIGTAAHSFMALLECGLRRG
jgi:hypothetical protein